MAAVRQAVEALAGLHVERGADPFKTTPTFGPTRLFYPEPGQDGA